MSRKGCAPTAKAKNWLEHHSDDSWSVYDVSGERWHYAPLKDDAPSLLQHISEPCGNAILLEWNANNTLHALTDSAGQRVVCRYDRDRLAGAWLDDGSAWSVTLMMNSASWSV